MISDAAWIVGTTLLTSDMFILVRYVAGVLVVLMTEEQLPVRDSRRWRH